MKQAKLSIIVPIYNTSQYLRKCLDSVLEQTYKNIEIILVNDCSTDTSQEIIDEYCKKDQRFKCVNNPKNLGLFRARVAGASEATGEYITFLDSDDYLTIDFYRTMMYNIIKNKSDMVAGNTILEFDDGRRTIFNINDMKFDVLEGDNLLNNYFAQRGLNFSWHTIWNKIYSMDIWKKAVKHYEKVTTHLIMTEDFAFSTVLFYYANKMTFVENDGLYYCKHESSSSTSLTGITIKKTMKNLQDLITSFNFVEDFMKEVNIYETYEEDFLEWKRLYRSQQESYLEFTNFTDEEKKQAIDKIEEFSNRNGKKFDDDYFSGAQTIWCDTYEKIKQTICKPEIKYVSFDIFDTLIVRPFLRPTDLFILLDEEFRKITGEIGVDFSKMRINAEVQARNNVYKSNPEKEEVTLEYIYDILIKDYNIAKKIADKMKQKEIDAEIRFCTQRKSAFELYEMALSIGKKVICTSDMYLPKNVIEEILKKNGYAKIEKVYLSSELNLTKATGNLYTYVTNKLGIEPTEMVHIGDNYHSDVLKAQEKGINGIHLKKATDVFFDENITGNLGKIFKTDLPDWQDNVSSMQFLGTRTMVALAANKYFDNPYRSFNIETEFNADPYFIGYYALGMHLFGVTNWLRKGIEENNYDSVVFMARDGYLPLEAYKIFRKTYKNLPEEKYLYISRKASMPIVIKNEHDLYKISEIISWYNNTPNGILKYVRNVFNINETKLKQICTKENINLNEKFTCEAELYKFISLLAHNFFNQEEHNKKLKYLEKYFGGYFSGKSCAFDIGYSARLELYLSELCKKGIDTYFININDEEAIKHAKIGKFKLHTFYDYKPTFTGLLRETLFSKCAPSCIEYKVDNMNVTEVFEEYKQNYAEKFLINKIQTAALEFIEDVASIFGSDIDHLYYQNYYISMPYESLLQSPSIVDRQVMRAIIFEDDIRSEEKISVVEQWNKEINCHNQQTLNALFNINELNNIPHGVDLTNRSKFIKLIYYVFIDRVPLKNKVSNKLKKYKVIHFVSKKSYRLLRNAKNFCYRITIKDKSDV